ncbi:MAG: hypothetical protein ABJB03_02150 [Rhodoglobus sp.]
MELKAFPMGLPIAHPTANSQAVASSIAAADAGSRVREVAHQREQQPDFDGAAYLTSVSAFLNALVRLSR